ncbi:MAG TPA: D-2-hydroxyacid dehydrogenase [Candidatus Fimousia stercorigallinarum]|nr:D-2-hydroxyacid dehydrogenase [Candidatus Fimousia stercorigallinarum]
MNIVFLDVKTIGEDIDLSGFDALGTVIKYENSTEQESLERSKDADILVVNKIPVNEKTIGKADHLKLVCEAATGTDNLDKAYLAQRGIAWRNVAGYSTEIVAQHTFALLFYVMEKLAYYDRFVKSGAYAKSDIFTDLTQEIHEVYGKTWGIIGLGAIGRRVAAIAEAFGANVIYASASGQSPQEGYHQVDLDTLYKESDIISVHAPLNVHTKGMIDAKAFSKMKKNCIFLNLGRGPIVVEEDLGDALEQNEIAGAGLDVLCHEPMTSGHPLLRIQDSGKLIITPHTAWASVEARTKLMGLVLAQIKEFLKES